MTDAILETTVFVDFLRNHPPAVQWFQAQTQTTYGITPIIWIEVIGGGRTLNDRARAMRLLLQFEMIRLTETDQDWAMQTFMTFGLSHGVGKMDCLIASVSYRLQIPLYTHNLKHFTPILGALAQKPYP